MEHREALTPSVVLWYDDALFKPGTDSFLLAAFAAPKAGDRVCDLGAGTGLLGLLVLARNASLTLANVELREQALVLARRGFDESGFADRVSFYPGDLRRREALPPAGSMDYVLSNPPYFAPGSGAVSPAPQRRAARSEEEGCTLQDVCAAAKYLLRWGGRFALVHRPERLTDVLCTLRENALEPKRLRFVQQAARSAPSLLLVESVRGGRSGVTAEPPLLLQSDGGGETAELRRAYFREG